MTKKKVKEVHGVLVPPPDPEVPSTLRNGGYPRKYPYPSDMKPFIQEYFELCLANDTPATIMGLAQHLDLSRVSLWSYCKLPEFQEMMVKAKEYIGNQIVSKCLKNKYNNAMGIFYMKNVFDWSDKREIQEKKDPKQLEIFKEMIEAKKKSMMLSE